MTKSENDLLNRAQELQINALATAIKCAELTKGLLFVSEDHFNLSCKNEQLRIRAGAFLVRANAKDIEEKLKRLAEFPLPALPPRRC